MSHGKAGSRAPRAQRSQPHGSYRCASSFAATDDEQVIMLIRNRYCGLVLL